MLISIQAIILVPQPLSNHPGLEVLKGTPEFERRSAAFNEKLWLYTVRYAMLAPLREYLKNVLRGRARWGLKHRLTATWAELPTARAELTNEEAFPRRAVKRLRAGPSTGGEAPPAMHLLE